MIEDVNPDFPGKEIVLSFTNGFIWTLSTLHLDIIWKFEPAEGLTARMYLGTASSYQNNITYILVASKTGVNYNDFQSYIINGSSGLIDPECRDLGLKRFPDDGDDTLFYGHFDTAVKEKIFFFTSFHLLKAFDILNNRSTWTYNAQNIDSSAGKLRFFFHSKNGSSPILHVFVHIQVGLRYETIHLEFYQPTTPELDISYELAQRTIHPNIANDIDGFLIESRSSNIRTIHLSLSTDEDLAIVVWTGGNVSWASPHRSFTLRTCTIDVETGVAAAIRLTLLCDWTYKA